jgi:hypothetical protein
MFAPHNGVHGNFSEIWRTAQYFFYFFKFFFAKAQLSGLLQCGNHGVKVRKFRGGGLNGEKRFLNSRLELNARLPQRNIVWCQSYKKLNCGVLKARHERR